VNYYQNQYTPKNMVILAAGDFSGIDPAAEIKKAFSKFPQREKLVETIPEEIAVGENRRIVEYKDINREYLGIAFAAPKAADRDSLVMDLILNILGTGRASRFNREIREKGFVTGISTYYPTPKDPGLFIISVTSDPGKSEKALDKIMQEIGRLKSEAVSDAELARALNMIESEYAVSHETPEGAARSIGFFAAVADVEYDSQYLMRIMEIKAPDIKRVAEKYFDRHTVVILKPKQR
jgi:predicted Zn-dependent peptidase